MAATELAAREGLEATLQGKEQLIETLRSAATDIEAQLAKSRGACDELSVVKAELQETCHQAQLANSVLEQKLDEQARRIQEEAQRAAAREQELSSRYAEAKQASEAREAAMEGRLIETEARLDDARLEGTSMMEQIAELKAAVASELRAQEELKKQHQRALADQAAVLDGERKARQEEQQQHAAALSAAESKARAEALARRTADARADCAGVVESLINGVENSLKIKQFREQLVRFLQLYMTPKASL
jgi:chromosome segregation ATPase